MTIDAMDQATLVGTAFGGLLRRWRNARRLSQLELSLSSEVSQRHLSFLESGRGNPSREMVLHLCDCLDIPLRDRNALLQAAGFAQAFHCSQLDADGMVPVLDALKLILEHHDPFPALVVDRDWNLLMANRGWANLLSLAGEPAALWQRTCGDGARNVVRLCFHADGLRPLIANWEAVAPAILERLHKELAASPSAGLAAIIRELQHDHSIPSRWHQLEPGQPLAPVLPIELSAGGAELRLFSMISTFGTPQDITTDELRVETFFPADAGSEGLLRNINVPG